MQDPGLKTTVKKDFDKVSRLDLPSEQVWWCRSRKVEVEVECSMNPNKEDGFLDSHSLFRLLGIRGNKRLCGRVAIEPFKDSWSVEFYKNEESTCTLSLLSISTYFHGLRNWMEVMKLQLVLTFVVSCVFIFFLPRQTIGNRQHSSRRWQRYTITFC